MFASSGDFGITHQDRITKGSSIFSTNGNASGGREVISNPGAASIAFADGTVITGTIDNTSAIREAGNAAVNVTTVKSLLSLWGGITDSVTDIATDVIKAN